MHMLGPHNTLMWSVYLTSSAILFEEEKKKCKFSRFAHILFTGLFGSFSMLTIILEYIVSYIKRLITT